MQELSVFGNFNAMRSSAISLFDSKLLHDVPCLFLMRSVGMVSWRGLWVALYLLLTHTQKAAPQVNSSL